MLRPLLLLLLPLAAQGLAGCVVVENAGRPCDAQDDCVDDYTCIFGRCERPCDVATDCEQGRTCFEGACVVLLADGDTDAGTAVRDSGSATDAGDAPADAGGPLDAGARRDGGGVIDIDNLDGGLSEGGPPPPPDAGLQDGRVPFLVDYGCACDNSDTCSEQGCGHVLTPHCDAVNPCADDYRCEDGICMCDDDMACAPTCSAPADCPPNRQCDSVTGRCRSPTPFCLTDTSCGPNQVCAGTSSPYCAPGGFAGVGALCDAHHECTTGLCATGRCLEPCSTRADCPSGFACATGAGSEGRAACRLDASCEPVCGQDQYCRGGTCETGCDGSADCDGGDCLLNAESALRMCATTLRCPDPLELLVRGTEADACVVDRSCWRASDCDGDMNTCLGRDDVNLAAPTGGPGLCGRLL